MCCAPVRVQIYLTIFFLILSKKHAFHGFQDTRLASEAFCLRSSSVLGDFLSVILFARHDTLLAPEVPGLRSSSVGYACSVTSTFKALSRVTTLFSLPRYTASGVRVLFTHNFQLFRA